MKGRTISPSSLKCWARQTCGLAGNRNALFVTRPSFLPLGKWSRLRPDRIRGIVVSVGFTNTGNRGDRNNLASVAKLGRRAWFRTTYLTMCRFDSCRSHHQQQEFPMKPLCNHKQGYRISWPLANDEWTGHNWIVCLRCSFSASVPSTWLLADSTLRV